MHLLAKTHTNTPPRDRSRVAEEPKQARLAPLKTGSPALLQPSSRLNHFWADGLRTYGQGAMKEAARPSEVSETG